jgi:hypothetical protein
MSDNAANIEAVMRVQAKLREAWDILCTSKLPNDGRLGILESLIASGEYLAELGSTAESNPYYKSERNGQ